MIGVGLRATFLLAASITVAGCSGPERSPERGAPPERVSPRPAAVRDPARVLQWSTPVHYHGIEVRFELPPGVGQLTASIDRLPDGDAIRCGEFTVRHRFQRFEVGGIPHRLAAGSRVFLFRAPSRDAPWQTRAERIALAWEGNGRSPVLREDRRDGTVAWYFDRAEVEWDGEGELIHRRGSGGESRFPTPRTLILGASGEIVENRPSVR